MWLMIWWYLSLLVCGAGAIVVLVGTIKNMRRIEKIGMYIALAGVVSLSLGYFS